MLYWTFFGVFLLIFVISFLKNKRAFSNIFLLLICIFLFILAAGMSEDGNILRAIALFLVFTGGFCMLIMPFVFIWAGILSIKRDGLSLAHCISILFGIGMWAAFIALIMAVSNFSSSLTVMGIVILAAMMMAYVLFTFVGFFLYSELCLILPTNPHCDFVIVHGARILQTGEVTPLLKTRLDKGIEVFRRSGTETTKIIVSGGQGSDEVMAEAEAMKRYLLAQGIPESSILKEDKSTTTWENLLFSKEIMDSLKDQYKVLFVTNNYHVFRTGVYAHKIGLKAEGIGCRTALYYWPNAFIREYAALIIKQKAMPVFILIVWAVLLAISASTVNF